jgi:hypothetical protein
MPPPSTAYRGLFDASDAKSRRPSIAVEHIRGNIEGLGCVVRSLNAVESPFLRRSIAASCLWKVMVHAVRMPSLIFLGTEPRLGELGIARIRNDMILSLCGGRGLSVTGAGLSPIRCVLPPAIRSRLPQSQKASRPSL